VADPTTWPGEWLTLTAAAEQLGWRLHRMRSLARRQDWPKRRPNAGATFEYLIPAGLIAEPPTRPEADDGLVATGPVAELHERVTDLAARLGRAEGELAAEARRSTDLQDLVADLRRERDRLATELAEARKGWLERLIEAVRRR
jgi:hypothetical protein